MPFKYFSDLLAGPIYKALEVRYPTKQKYELWQIASGFSTLLMLALSYLVIRFFQGSFNIAGLAIRTDAFRSAVHSHPKWVALGLTLILTVLGAMASLFKRKNQALYGLVELLFAFASSFLLFSNMQSPPQNTPSALQNAQAVPQYGQSGPQEEQPLLDFSKLLAIVSTVYLIARAFNNISEGQPKTTGQPKPSGIPPTWSAALRGPAGP